MSSNVRTRAAPTPAHHRMTTEPLTSSGWVVTFSMAGRLPCITGSSLLVCVANPAPLGVSCQVVSHGS